MKKFIAASAVIILFSLILNSCSQGNTENNIADKSFAVYEITDVIQDSDYGFVDFTFKKDGKDVKFSEFVKNKPVFLNFWGTWCPPCRKEIPDIIEISAENKGLIVAGIALERSKDIAERQESVEKYGDENKLNYVNFVINPEIEGELINAYKGITAVPTTFILKGTGEVSEKIVGMRSKEQFMEFVKVIINEGA